MPEFRLGTRPMDHGITRTHDPKNDEQRETYRHKLEERSVFTSEQIFYLSQKIASYHVIYSAKLIIFEKFYEGYKLILTKR